MTSEFEPKGLQERVNAQLDQANEQLSEDVLSDIAQVRQQAIRRAVNNAAKQKSGKWGAALFTHHGFQIAAPAAFAVAMVLLVNYDTNESVPALPSEFLAADVPMEDLSLLEDLEFASWLAQQEQEVSI